MESIIYADFIKKFQLLNYGDIILEQGNGDKVKKTAIDINVVFSYFFIPGVVQPPLISL